MLEGNLFRTVCPDAIGHEGVLSPQSGLLHDCNGLEETHYNIVNKHNKLLPECAQLSQRSLSM